MYRHESDSLGQRKVPDIALYGINTLRGAENFDITARKIGGQPALLRALASIKMAAARANTDIGAISDDQSSAICLACQEIIAGQHDDQFIIDMLDGSGGTSINMNANEVIANRALQIMGYQSGQYERLHPNNHVNLCQSTNDVVPSAIKLALIDKSVDLLNALQQLATALHQKSDEFASVLKVGRTCMQAAQPMTLGQEFGGYASAIDRTIGKISIAFEDLHTLPLGGTAIGTGLVARPGYKQAVYHHLSNLLSYPVSPSPNMFDGMQNADSFARVSAELRIAAELIGKISLDLIMLSSGTKSGIGEIRLAAVQAGSSIMPGKVNPVLPIMMQQIAYAVAGNDVAVSLAFQGGQLEINHFEPLIADRLFDTMDLLTKGSRTFAKKCISRLEANEDQALENLLGSSALATVFVPALGYEKVTETVKNAEAEGKTFVEAAVDLGILTKSEVTRATRCATQAPRSDACGHAQAQS